MTSKRRNRRLGIDGGRLPQPRARRHRSVCMSGLARPALARRRWPLFLPFGLVVLLAAGWTGLWFYAAARAETEIATFRARERQAGRLQECASQSISGYPFRIEVRCAGAMFELKGSPTLQLKLPVVLAAVQV